MNYFTSSNGDQSNVFVCYKNSSIRPSTTNHSTSGDGSFNAGQNNTINGNITIGAINTDLSCYVKRTKAKPLRIADHHIKITWIISSGTLGVIAGATSIISDWSNSNLLFFLVSLLGIIVSTSLLFIGVKLKNRLFNHTAGLTFESDKSGQAYSTKIEGPCPKCDGVLKLKNIGQRENRITILRCTRNPEHWGPFDPTQLGTL